MHHRALFDPGRPGADRTADAVSDLLDHQLDVGAYSFVVQRHRTA
jgi:hypothetical protein